MCCFWLHQPKPTKPTGRKWSGRGHPILIQSNQTSKHFDAASRFLPIQQVGEPLEFPRELLSKNRTWEWWEGRCKISSQNHEATKYTHKENPWTASSTPCKQHDMVYEECPDPTANSTWRNVRGSVHQGVSPAFPRAPLQCWPGLSVEQPPTISYLRWSWCRKSYIVHATTHVDKCDKHVGYQEIPVWTWRSSWEASLLWQNSPPTGPWSWNSQKLS